MKDPKMEIRSQLQEYQIKLSLPSRTMQILISLKGSKPARAQIQVTSNLAAQIFLPDLKNRQSLLRLCRSVTYLEVKMRTEGLMMWKECTRRTLGNIKRAPISRFNVTKQANRQLNLQTISKKTTLRIVTKDMMSKWDNLLQVPHHAWVGYLKMNRLQQWTRIWWTDS